MLIVRLEIVTVAIFYFRPDYRHILQELVWQTEDRAPELPKVRRYLNHWRENIDAVVSDVIVSVGAHRVRNVGSLINYGHRA